MIFSDMKSRYEKRKDFSKYRSIKRLWSISLPNYIEYVGKVNYLILCDIHNLCEKVEIKDVRCFSE